jgi:hypothetical protein
LRRFVTSRPSSCSALTGRLMLSVKDAIGPAVHVSAAMQ